MFTLLILLEIPAARALIIFQSEEFFLDDAAGIILDYDNEGPGADVDIIANQGSDPDGTIRYNSTTNQWELSNNGGGFIAIATAPLDLRAVQARQTGTIAVAGAFTDVTFDATDLENDITAVEHDDTNTDRILINADGIYQISYDLSVTLSSTVLASSTANARVRLNDTTVLSGSTSTVSIPLNVGDLEQEMSQSFTLSLTNGDFLSLQLMSADNAPTVNAGAIFTVTKMEGVKGDPGDANSTNDTTFTLDADNAGAGTNVSIIANQGTNADGIIRYNTTLNVWEFSNDGVTFQEIGSGGGGGGSTNAASLDGLDSTQFLRSDTTNSFSSGTLTFDAGTTLDLDAATVFLDEISSNNLILDSDNTGGDVTLQFGGNLAETLVWNATTTAFDLSDDLNITGGLSVSSSVDFNQQQAIALVLENGTVFPLTPVVGQKYFRTDLSQEFVYTGSSWVSGSSAGGSGTVVYIPEFADSVISTDGTNNDGILYGDRDIVNFKNHYQWTSTKTTLQDIDIVMSIRLPDGFTGFQATPIQVEYMTSTATLADADLDITVLDTANAAVSTIGASDLNNVAWTTADITFGGTPTFTAGENITINFKLQTRKAGTDQSVFLGNVFIHYLQ